jgi:hypothetical protein
MISFDVLEVEVDQLLHFGSGLPDIDSISEHSRTSNWSVVDDLLMEGTDFAPASVAQRSQLGG